MKVVVIIARGLQLSALSCYGNPWIETPALDALAAEGVVFDQHFADAAEPAEARRVWRSGRYSSPGADLLACLRQRSVSSHLLVDASRPAPSAFAEGWDSVEFVEVQEDQLPLETMLYEIEVALNDLKQRDNWLLWIDFATLLQPWEPPEEYQETYFEDEPAEEDETGQSEALQPLGHVVEGSIDPQNDSLYVRLQSSYAAALSYLDGGIGRILDHLGDTLEETLIIVTTDVGQALGEHGNVGLPGVHEENIHLPLVMRLPSARCGGAAWAGDNKAVDLAPTLADVFEAPLPDAQGVTLLPLIYADAEKVRDFACAWLPNVACLRTPGMGTARTAVAGRDSTVVREA